MANLKCKGGIGSNKTLILNKQVKEATKEKEWTQGGGVVATSAVRSWPIES